jgi:spermidine synthase
VKKIISYLWPITHRFSSEINGALEITYLNGKKVLDTANANYSYGSLQKILEYGLAKLNFSQVENILVLGMGGGSVIHSLRNTFKYSKNIVAVEIDPQIIKIAKDEFGITSSEKLQIIEANALEFVKTSEEKFQLIIIDVFVDTLVPTAFYGKEFCVNIQRLISSGGYFLLNAGLNLDAETETLKNWMSTFANGFQLNLLSKVNGTNTLLIGQKKPEFEFASL